MMIDYHTHFLTRAHFGPDFTREWDERGGTGAWPEITAEQFEQAMEPFDKAVVFGITAHALGIDSNAPREHGSGTPTDGNTSTTTRRSVPSCSGIAIPGSTPA